MLTLRLFLPGLPSTAVAGGCQAWLGILESSEHAVLCHTGAAVAQAGLTQKHVVLFLFLQLSRDMPWEPFLGITTEAPSVIDGVSLGREVREVGVVVPTVCHWGRELHSLQP